MGDERMSPNMSRRDFLGASMGVAAAACVTRAAHAQPATARVGVIGTGGRGTGLLGILVGMKDVRVPAICDIDPSAAERAQGIVTGAGQPKPEAYTRDEYVYRELVARDDLDA